MMGNHVKTRARAAPLGGAIMDIPLVVPSDWMDDETFLIHFERRHGDQLPGMDGFIDNVHGSTVNSYRVFHDTIHRLFPIKHAHEHEEVHEHE